MTETNDLKEMLRQTEVLEDVADFINDIKQVEEKLAGMLAEYQGNGAAPVDPRHIAIARTHFETAFTFAVKAIINNKDNRVWNVPGR